MDAVRLRLLGGFACETPGSTVTVPSGLQRLMAYLAVRGASHRNVVAGSLWPEKPESQALASLRTGVWRVNKAVPGIVVADGASLAVADHVEVDTHDQEAFAYTVLRDHVDDVVRLEAGLHTLWSGELLPGWYDDWVVFERERLSQLRLHALELVARLLTRRGHYDTALQLALEAIRIEPLRETANAVLINVYLAEGNVSDAIHQYEVFREMLWCELGCEPSERISQLLPSRPRTSRAQLRQSRSAALTVP